MRREIDGFRIEGGRLTLANRHELAEQPIKMLKLFRVAQSREMDVPFRRFCVGSPRT